MEIIGHRGEPWGDDAPDVIAGAIHDIEGYGRAEVDDQGGCAAKRFDCESVREAVGTDGSWFWIIDADAAQSSGI